MRAALLAAAVAVGAAVAVAQQPTPPPHDIEAYGAVSGDGSLAAAVANGAALYAALAAANAGANASRAVLVRAGGNYTLVPHADVWNLTDVTLLLDGTLTAWWGGDINKTMAAWPQSPGGSALTVLAFAWAAGLTITGAGAMHGNGYGWWEAVLTASVPDNRPNLLGIAHSTRVTLAGFTLANSPAYHALLDDVLHVLVEDTTIYVDVEGQRNLLAGAGRLTTGGRDVGRARLPPDADAHPGAYADALPAGIPTFPLNTDGWDIAGRNVTVRRANVTNFDDALCVKPLAGGNSPVAGPCARDYVWEDSVVQLGVGLSIGSVPPRADVNCVRNVTYRNITMTSPIKGLYVKPNPGNATGVTGVIDGVTYEDITMTGALWWSVYVGTQQQSQPGGGADTGCSFFWPLPNTTCPPQPRVPVTNLTLRNVRSVDALLSAGVLTCANATAEDPTGPYPPCTGWAFTNVTVTSLTNWPVAAADGGWFCRGVPGIATAGAVSPSPRCVY
jgi:hypothetical protein